MSGPPHVVIKAHVRSDGSAAEWLAGRLSREIPGLKVALLPGSLHQLPVEALASAASFSCACSLGSCSLPDDIGIKVPHYVSPAAAEEFDRAWVQPFWANYEGISLRLVEEGICRNVDQESES